MKTKLVIGFLLTAAIQSHAIVADKIACKIELNDFKSGQTAIQEHEFFVSREPLSSSPAPDIRITSGFSEPSVSIQGKGYRLTAKVNLSTSHAMKLDNSGNIIQAKQESCNTLVANYCIIEKDNTSSCPVSSVACPWAEPFSDGDHVVWSPVSISNNVPAFDSLSLGSKYKEDFIVDGKKVGTAKAQCHYRGTFN